MAWIVLLHGTCRCCLGDVGRGTPTDRRGGALRDQNSPKKPRRSPRASGGFDYALIAFSKKALSKLSREKKAGHAQQVASFQCSTSQGAGTQHPVHFSCAPARSHTITANSKATTKQQTKRQQTPPPPPTERPQTARGRTGGEGRKRGRAALRRMPTFTLFSPRLRPPVHHRARALGPRCPGLAHCSRTRTTARHRHVTKTEPTSTRAAHPARNLPETAPDERGASSSMKTLVNAVADILTVSSLH